MNTLLPTSHLNTGFNVYRGFKYNAPSKWTIQTEQTFGNSFWFYFQDKTGSVWLFWVFFNKLIFMYYALMLWLAILSMGIIIASESGGLIQDIKNLKLYVNVAIPTKVLDNILALIGNCCSTTLLIAHVNLLNFCVLWIIESHNNHN